MRDRYFNALRRGDTIVDLREGKQQNGEVIGSGSPGSLLVRWENDEEETVFESDVVMKARATTQKRRRRL